MTAKQRSLRRQFTPIGTSKYPTLLVSGCSYTWNNSEQCAVTWPYYLRDLLSFEQVVDCSQPGSGYNHTHTAVITQLETNTALTPESTMVVVMWSGNERVDITADRAVTESWSNMEATDLGWGLSTVGLYRGRPIGRNWLGGAPNPEVEKLRDQYHRTVDSRGQVLESAVQLISLQAYLDQRGFQSVFLDWDDTLPVVKLSGMDPWAQNRFAAVETLGSWATRTDQRIPGDGHPTPDAHLSWTRACLIPHLFEKDLADPVHV